MATKRASADEIATKRAGERNDNGVHFKAALMAPKSFKAEERSAKFIMSDETPDSYGDIVRAKGVDLTRFESNPILLLNHSYQAPIGNWSDVKAISERVEGVATLAAEGTSEKTDEAYRLLEQGVLRAASVGFRIRDADWILDDEGNNTYGLDIKTWDMFECSIVAVPANPNALAKAMKEGSTIARDILEEVLDNWSKTAEGLIVPRETLEDAHKEGGGDKVSMSIKLSPELKAAFDDMGDKIADLQAKLTKADEDEQTEVDPTDGWIDEKSAAVDEMITDAPVKDEEKSGIAESIKSLLRKALGKPEPLDEERRSAALDRLKSSRPTE